MRRCHALYPLQAASDAGATLALSVQRGRTCTDLPTISRGGEPWSARTLSSTGRLGLVIGLVQRAERHALDGDVALAVARGDALCIEDLADSVDQSVHILHLQGASAGSKLVGDWVSGQVCE